MRLNDKNIMMPFLFINLNILNILDKIVTWAALKNPKISELNHIVQFFINRFGIDYAMIFYTIAGFIIISIAYKIATMKRMYCEKNNMSPETFFMGLNIIFYFVVINNIFQIFISR